MIKLWQDFGVGIDWSWTRRGACNGADPDMFITERGGEHLAQAKQVCAQCPVRPQCLEVALALPKLQGVWGGTSNLERRRIRREARRRPA